MRGRLYTLLKMKHELTVYEKFLMWVIGDISHEDYIHHLIELRDAGLIDEENNGDAIINRKRSITEDGLQCLFELKRLYLKELWLKNRWRMIAWLISALLSILFGLLDFLKT